MLHNLTQYHSCGFFCSACYSLPFEQETQPNNDHNHSQDALLSHWLVSVLCTTHVFMCNGEKLIKSLEEMTSYFSVNLMDISYKTKAQYNSMHNLKYSYNQYRKSIHTNTVHWAMFLQTFHKVYIDKPCGLVIKKQNINTL